MKLQRKLHPNFEDNMTRMNLVITIVVILGNLPTPTITWDLFPIICISCFPSMGAKC